MKCFFLDTINELSRSVKEFVAFNAKMRYYGKLTVMDKLVSIKLQLTNQITKNFLQNQAVP